MSTADDVRAWLEEQLAEVNEGGSASRILLEHKDATGRDTEIYTLRSGTPAWTTAEQMTGVLLHVSDRHCRGLIGQQSMRLLCFFGTSERPSRFLPFGMPGATQFGAIPGGFSTEGPTPVGQIQQSMRQAELIVQGAFSQNKHTFDIMVALIRDLSALVKDREEALRASNTELRDCWVAIKDMTAAFMEISTKIQVDVINAKRNAELLTDFAGLLPAAINGVTGKPIFPVAAADSEMLRKLVKLMDRAPGDVAGKLLEAGSQLAQEGGADGQAAWTLFMGRLDEIRKDGVTRAKRIEAMAGETAGTNFADALKNAAGRAVTSLREAGRKNDDEGGGGYSGSSHATEPAPALESPVVEHAPVEGGVAGGFAEFGEEFLAGLDDGSAGILIGMMRSKGRTDLADKAEKLRDVIKSRKASE